MGFEIENKHIICLQEYLLHISFAREDMYV
jgi:hypothetical protein